MKKRFSLGLIIGLGGFFCSVATAQTISSGHVLPMDYNTLYDFDGDGKMEFIDFYDGESSIQGKNIGFYLYNSLTVKPSAYKSIPHNIPIQRNKAYSIQLLNLNNDFYPDIALQAVTAGSFVSASGYFNLCLLSSTANGEYSSVPDTKVPYVVDVNQDGRTDILLSNNEYLLQDFKGNFQLVRYKEVDRNDKELLSKWQSSGDFTDNLGSGMGSDYPQVISDAQPVIKTGWGNYGLDYNKDGKMDFIDPLTGKLMINRGGNNYTASSLSAAVYVHDLNGDQIPDYVLYDTQHKKLFTLIYQSEKGYVRSTLYSNKEMDEKIYFYDTDKDGDVDIIVPFSGRDGDQFTYIAVFVNDGMGNFEMEENGFDKNFQFAGCKDIDNDGYVDFIAGVLGPLPNSYNYFYDYYLIKGGRGNQFVADDSPFCKFQSDDIYSGKRQSVCIADIDDDGIAEVLLSTETNSKTICIYKPVEATFNSAPDKMDAPTILFNEKKGTLQISWKKGTDKESSSVDLSYAIRIGSTPGKSDIYYAHARADGKRRNLQLGNMGYNRDVTLNTSFWNHGAYYISVQAIDPLFKGSPWSDETVFNHDSFYADFTVDKHTTFSSDTVTVKMDVQPDPQNVYTWDWDGAVMLEEHVVDGHYKMYWIEPGVKNVKLNVKRVADGMVKNYQQEIKVYGNSLEKSNRTDYDTPFDFNQDGVTDIFRIDGRSGFMKNDGKGAFSSLPGLFNTDIPNQSSGMYSSYDPPHIGDYNKDGLPDAFVLFAELLYTNKGDYKFNKTGVSLDGIDTEASYQIFDMDNDGDYDILRVDEYWEYGKNYRSKTEMFQNQGNNTFEKVPFSLREEKINIPRDTYLADLNKDGYMDIIQKGDNEDNYYFKTKEWCVLMNQGNKTFKVLRMAIPQQYINSKGGLGYENYFKFADMNNDGYIDMIRCSDYCDYEITIFYFDGSSFFNNVKIIPFPSDLTPSYYGDNTVTADFDNNGYQDLLVRLDESYGIFYMYEGNRHELKLFTGIGYNNSNNNFIDLNGDRIPDLLWTQNRSAIKNTLPTVPQNLRARQTEAGTVLIEWDAATDKESPQTQLRYNLSVKRKGASGAQSFVISPMNGLNNSATVVPSHQYIAGTRYEVPLYVMPVGDYEIQLQSIDLWNESSDMSSVYNFSVETKPLIGLPPVAYSGKVAQLYYTGTIGSTLAWDWDGGTVQAVNDNCYSVLWNSPGVKNISVTTDGILSKGALRVKELGDIVTNIPPVAYVNQKHLFHVLHKGGERGTQLTLLAKKKDGKTFEDLASCGMVFAQQSDSLYTIQCSQEGDYEIKLLSNDGFCMEKSVVCSVEVRPALPPAEFECITANANGKNTLIWAQSIWPSYITSRVIYKESIRAGVYDKLAVIPISQLTFTDLSSNASLQSYRYKSAYLTAEGVEGECGSLYSTIHLMINKSIRGWNLIWNQFEGASVSTYRIYRGKTADQLSMLAEVSGNVNSYTDLSAQDLNYYYAIEVEKNNLTRSSTFVLTRSNVQSTNFAVNTIMAEKICILGLEESLELSERQLTLHLYAEIYPMLATYRAVNWQIVSGQQYAEIDQNGLLTAKPSQVGTVVVRATALDGSGVFVDLLINKQQTSDIEEIAKDEVRLTIYPSVATTDFTVSGMPTDESEATVSVFAINGEMVYQQKTKSREATINCSSFAKGFHVVRVRVEDDVFLEKVIVK